MAWIIVGSLFALVLVVAIVFVVRSKRRNRRGLCAHCGGGLDSTHTFRVMGELLCRSCAEDSEDWFRLLAFLYGIIGAPGVLITGIVSVSLLSDGEVAGWVKIVAAVFWLAGILNLVFEALRASLRPSRLSIACASMWMLALIILMVVALRSGESRRYMWAFFAAAAFSTGLQAVRFRKEALRLSKELET